MSSIEYNFKYIIISKLFKNLLIKKKIEAKICSVDNCLSKIIAKNLCGKHWQRLRKYGSPDICHKYDTKNTLIPWLSNGYLHIYYKRKAIRLHRYIMEQHLNRNLTSDEIVHHINGDRLDNRIENLEVIINNGTHTKIHKKLKYKNCISCGKESLSWNDGFRNGLCKRCYGINRRKNIKNTIGSKESKTPLYRG